MFSYEHTRGSLKLGAQYNLKVTCEQPGAGQWGWAQRKPDGGGRRARCRASCYLNNSD